MAYRRLSPLTRLGARPEARAHGRQRVAAIPQPPRRPARPPLPDGRQPAYPKLNNDLECFRYGIGPPVDRLDHQRTRRFRGVCHYQGSADLRGPAWVFSARDANKLNGGIFAIQSCMFARLCNVAHQPQLGASLEQVLPELVQRRHASLVMPQPLVNIPRGLGDF